MSPHHATPDEARRTLPRAVNCRGSRRVATRDVRDPQERWIGVPPGATLRLSRPQARLLRRGATGSPRPADDQGQPGTERPVRAPPSGGASTPDCRAERRLRARSLRPSPSLSVMPVVDAACSRGRVGCGVTSLDVALGEVSVMPGTNGPATAGWTRPELTHAPCGMWVRRHSPDEREISAGRAGQGRIVGPAPWKRRRADQKA